jgi:hypothetical protein
MSNLDRFAACDHAIDNPAGPGASLVTHENVPGRRGQHHAHHRSPVFHQGNIDRELTVALDEFLGSVQRVDHEIALAQYWNDAGGNAFLAQDGQAGFAQKIDDHGFGRRIGFRYRRAVILGDDMDRPVVNGADHSSGGNGSLHRDVGDCRGGYVGHQAHLVPPIVTSRPRSSGLAPMVIWLVEI